VKGRLRNSCGWKPVNGREEGVTRMIWKEGEVKISNSSTGVTLSSCDTRHVGAVLRMVLVVAVVVLAMAVSALDGGARVEVAVSTLRPNVVSLVPLRADVSAVNATFADLP